MSNIKRRQRNNKRMNKSKQSGRRRRAGQEGNLITRINPRFPNDIKMLPIHNRAFRYNCTAQTDFQVTPQMLLKQLVATVSGSTAAFTIIGSVRLRRISIYSVLSNGDFGTATQELVFQWLGNLNTPSNLITDRGTPTSPACIKVVPPRESRAGMWFSVSTTDYTQPYFQFSCPINTILDIDVDYIINNGASLAVTLSGAASTTGVAFLNMSANITPDGEVYTVSQ